MAMTKRDAEWILGLDEMGAYDWSQLHAAYLIALRERNKASFFAARQTRLIKKAYRMLKGCTCDVMSGWDCSASGMIAA